MGALQQYERALIELHREMLAGTSGSSTADAHRDEMECLAGPLGEEDRELCAELSEDLYVIEGKAREVPLPGDAAGWTAEQRLTLANDTYRSAVDSPNDRERFRLALMQFRSVAGVIKPPARAYMLGRCWGTLGFHLAASCFFDFAFRAEERPHNAYAFLALDALAKAGETEELARRLSHLEKRPDADAMLLLQAATLLLQLAAHEDPERQDDTYRRLVRLVERSVDDTRVLPAIRAAARVAEGFAQGHLGNDAAALVAFSHAVTVKEFDATLVARGLALLSTSPLAALEDFRRAAESGTTLVQPFLYLAHHELTENRPEGVLMFAKQGMRVAQPGPSRARLCEWAAIASAQLGKPETEISALFDCAIQNDPLDEMLRRNVERFETARQDLPKTMWDFDAPDIARARDELEHIVSRTPPLAA